MQFPQNRLSIRVRGPAAPKKPRRQPNQARGLVKCSGFGDLTRFAPHILTQRRTLFEPVKSLIEHARQRRATDFRRKLCRTCRTCRTRLIQFDFFCAPFCRWCRTSRTDGTRLVRQDRLRRTRLALEKFKDSKRVRHVRHVRPFLGRSLVNHFQPPGYSCAPHRRVACL